MNPRYEGFCRVCGKYTDGLLYVYDGICLDCYEKEKKKKEEE